LEKGGLLPEKLTRIRHQGNLKTNYAKVEINSRNFFHHCLCRSIVSLILGSKDQQDCQILHLI
jgi:hypothetical protein